MRLPVPAPPAGSRPFDAVGLGMNAVDYLVVVDRVPESGQKVEVLDHRVLPGGQAATAMAALARLGRRARYVGRVGTDEAGRVQLESLAADGVDTAACQVVEGGDSSVSFIVVERATGERTVMWRGGVATSLDASDAAREVATSGRALLLDAHNPAAERVAAAAARAAGIPVVLDVDIDHGGDELYPLVDYLISSAGFPLQMTGASDERAALLALSERYGCALVAMTLGDRGALALCGGRFVESPAIAAPIVDTTGAGDAFHAGFIHALLDGLDLEGALRVANAVAALNCGALGARTALPARARLDELLASA